MKKVTNCLSAMVLWLVRYLNKKLIAHQFYGLVPAIQSALKEWFFDQNRLAELDWSGLPEKPTVQQINGVLAQMGDPHTVLISATGVSAAEESAHKQPAAALAIMGGVCYLRPEFGVPGFAEKISNLFAENVFAKQGLILDLRNNPGGRIGESMMVSALLMPRRNTVLCVTRLLTNGKNEVPTAILSEPVPWSRRRRVVRSFPWIGEMAPIPLLNKACAKLRPHVVVLVNENTVSAAELAAAAIQEHGRGQVVGTRTFGKGTGQQSVPLHDENGAPLELFITCGRSFTPAGHWLGDGDRTRHGLTPNYVVEQNPDAKLGEPGRDAQLDYALHLLNQLSSSDHRGLKHLVSTWLAWLIARRTETASKQIH